MALTLREQGREHLAHGWHEIIPPDYCNSLYYPINYDFILFTQSATNFRQATSPLQHSPIVFSCRYHCNGFSCHQMLLIRVYTLAANTTLLPYYCFYNLLLAEAPNHTSLINRAHIRLRSFFALFGLLHLLYRYCSFNYDIAHYLHSRDMLKINPQISHPTVVEQGVENGVSGSGREVFYQPRELMNMTDPDCQAIPHTQRQIGY